MPNCFSITNNASIKAANEPSIYSGNNTAFVDIATQCPQPNVITSKTVYAVSGNFLPGATVEYTLSYSNH